MTAARGGGPRSLAAGEEAGDGAVESARGVERTLGSAPQTLHHRLEAPTARSSYADACDGPAGSGAGHGAPGLVAQPAGPSGLPDGAAFLELLSGDVGGQQVIQLGWA